MFSCDEPSCPTQLPSYSTHSADFRGALLARIIRTCPGPWKPTYATKTEAQILRIAYALEFQWELGADLRSSKGARDALGEALAHRFWQYARDFNELYPLGASNSVNGRLTAHFGVSLGGVRATGEQRLIHQRPDSVVWPEAMIAAQNIFGRYRDEAGSDWAHQHKPYEWGNPSSDYISGLLGREQGVCPMQVYYISGGHKNVLPGDFCVLTYHQNKCEDEEPRSLCEQDCRTYKTVYYPGAR